MSQPYRPAELDAALRCETCGAHPDDTGAPRHSVNGFLLWECVPCDRIVQCELPGLDDTTVDDLCAVLALTGLRPAPPAAEATSGVPDEVNGDRVLTVRLRLRCGVGEIAILHALRELDQPVGLEFGPDGVAVTGPADTASAAALLLAVHQLLEVSR